VARVPEEVLVRLKREVPWKRRTVTLDTMSRMSSGGEDWVYVYTADDERLFGYQIGGAQLNRFTLRDLGGGVLREYVQDRAQGYAWHVERDYVYREGQLPP
jgi:hypothetical protein